MVTPQERAVLEAALEEIRRRKSGSPGLSKPPEIRESALSCRLSFREFVRQAWHLIEPGRPLVENWAIHAVCDHLEAVTKGQIKKLIINIPPGFAKSSLVSVLWPCWDWTVNPHLRWMFASYAEKLSLRDSFRRRDVVISSEWYQERFGDLFKIQKDNERFFTNDRQGSMLATSTGGSVTGFRGERLVLDDPHDPQGAESEVQRESTAEWLSLTWPTRLNDTPLSAEVLVMQRLHETDATGLYLSHGGYEHLKIPMYYRGIKYSTSLGSCDPRTTDGEIIDSRVYSQDYVDKLAKRLGPYGVAGQFQQEPAPPEGGIIKRAWIRHYRKVEDRLDVGDYLIDPRNCIRFCTVDPAVTEKSTTDKQNDPDYTVMLAWAVFFSTRGPLLLLLDAIRDRMEGPDIIPKLEAFDRHWGFSIIGVETVAFQMMLFQEAKRKGLPVREIANKDGEDVIYRLDKDKVARAYAATPLMADGRFYAPDYAPWLEQYIKELTTFPNAAHDDYVDATSAGCAIAERMNRESALDIASRHGDGRINSRRVDGLNDNGETEADFERRDPWSAVRVRAPR